jgi:HAE1 family hydrophobic/amphiphilic exporter-1
VRAEGKLNTIEAIEDVVLRSEAQGNAGILGRVRVSDVAEVGSPTRKPRAQLRFRGEPALAFNLVREQGANVISVMEEVKDRSRRAGGRAHRAKTWSARAGL